ncbi:MAG: hypothetical protein FWE69_01700 [Clostridiales bacterium]|nr:hypothetical protein [Clostridiales bacterium]
MKKFLAILLLLTLCAIALPTARTALAADPIEMTITYAPDTELSDSGRVAWIKFTLHNKTNAAYALSGAVIESVAFAAPRVVPSLTIPANSVSDVTVNNVDIQGDWLGKPLFFTLRWETGVPSVAYSVTASIVIEKFSEPIMVVKSVAVKNLVRVGGTFEVKYTLSNPTKFDMTGLVLRDENVSQGNIPLTKTTLQAGETMTVTFTGTMGDNNISSRPVVAYTVRNKNTETQAETTILVESVTVALAFDVQPYPPTPEGTTFALIVTNSGTQTMTDIRVFDDINTLVMDKFALDAGESKSFSFTITPPSAAGQMRQVSFRATAVDIFGMPFAHQDPNTYDAVPYIESEQVNLSLIVKLTSLYYDASGSLFGLFDFEIRNYSQVSIREAKVLESQVFTAAPVFEVAALSTGVTAFQREYKLTDIKTLSFVLSASDISGQLHGTEPVTIDIAQSTLDFGPHSPQQPVDGAGASLLGRLGTTLLVIALVTVGLILIAGLVALGLYRAETEAARLLRSRQAREESPFQNTPLMDLEVPPVSEDILPDMPDEEAEEPVYVAPAKLRYLDTYQDEPVKSAQTPAAPIHVLREGRKWGFFPRRVTMPRQKTRRPLVWNEYRIILQNSQK